MPFGYGDKSTSPHLGKKFSPGESGNPNGVPKGTRHLSTYIREAMEDENFEFWKTHPIEGTKKYKQMPVKAITAVAVEKAVQGDDKAREWLAKYGWGQKTEIDVTTNGENVNQVDVNMLTQFLQSVQNDTKR